MNPSLRPAAVGEINGRVVGATATEIAAGVSWVTQMAVGPSVQMHRLSHAASVGGRRILGLLFVWLGEVPASPAATRLLRRSPDSLDYGHRRE